MQSADYNFDVDTADFMLKDHLEFFDGIQDKTVQLIQKVGSSFTTKVVIFTHLNIKYLCLDNLEHLLVVELSFFT